MHWRNKIGEKSKEMMQMQLACVYKSFYSLQKIKSKRIQHRFVKDISNEEKWENWARN